MTCTPPSCTSWVSIMSVSPIAIRDSISASPGSSRRRWSKDYWARARAGARQTRGSAKVQIGAVLLCKSGRDGARGDMLARGHGDTGWTREARRLRGSVDQITSEYRVWSIEYRERQSDGCRVTGTASGVQDSAIQVSAAGSWLRRLMAERQTPERMTTVAVTRHLKWFSTNYDVTRSRPYLDTPYSILHTPGFRHHFPPFEQVALTGVQGA
jgi:hypothetical protein